MNPRVLMMYLSLLLEHTRIILLQFLNFTLHCSPLGYILRSPLFHESHYVPNGFTKSYT